MPPDPASIPGFVMQDVCVRFGGFPALTGVSLEARHHQVLGVIGPNGAGKTTLLNVACGEVAPDSGRISWAGRELRRIRPRDLTRLGIARGRDVQLPANEATVLEHVMAGADPRPPSPFHSGRLGRPRTAREEREALERASDLLRSLGIAKHVGQPPDSLPLAVRRKVSLARTLVTDPQLLLLDELAGGLSTDEAAELAERVRALTRRMTVILVEHHLGLVMQACDHVVVLDSGRVIASGDPEQVSADPLVHAAYLDDGS